MHPESSPPSQALVARRMAAGRSLGTPDPWNVMWAAKAQALKSESSQACCRWTRTSLRVLRDARAVSALSHTHICSLFDIGHQDGID